MAQVAGSGEREGGGGNGNESLAATATASSTKEREETSFRWDYAVVIAIRSIMGLATTISVHLGDGITRAKAGERLKHAEVGRPARSWANDHFLFRDLHELGSIPFPAHPPGLAPTRSWYLLFDGNECGELEDVVESRGPRGVGHFDYVVVLREGLALPTRELLFVVNNAHAVLVLRGTKEYFYLSDDFVLTAPEEKALMEWGVGRPLLANSLLAVGGMLLITVVEDFWKPAVVGTLLVAAAGYRVQGTLTKLWRIRSDEWQESRHKLVPSGILGAERVVQGVMVTLVALADLLEYRWLLLAAVTLASMQVIVLEYVGQARLTWTFARFNSVMRVQLGVWICCSVVLLAWLLLSYLFAGFLSVVLTLGVMVRLLWPSLLISDRHMTVTQCVGASGVVGVGIWVTVLGWDDADLKFSWQSLQPWRWPLFRAPNSFSTGARIVGLWLGVLGGCVISAYIVVGMFSFRISSDGYSVEGLDKRTRAREVEGSPGFRHYDEKPIPSRHLLVPHAGQSSLTQPAPVASVV